MMLPLLQSKDQSDLLNAIFLSPSTTQSEQQVFNKNMLTPPPQKLRQELTNGGRERLDKTEQRGEVISGGANTEMIEEWSQ